MTDTTSGVASASTSRATTPSGNTVAELLADRQRRYLLHALRNADGESTLDELASKIAAWETEQSVADVSETTVERVRPSLYYNHVPRFEAAGFVAYDSDAVALTDDGEPLATLSNRESWRAESARRNE
jgi:hypothetical protein